MPPAHVCSGITESFDFGRVAEGLKLQQRAQGFDVLAESVKVLVVRHRPVHNFIAKLRNALVGLMEEHAGFALLWCRGEGRGGRLHLAGQLIESLARRFAMPFERLFKGFGGLLAVLAKPVLQTRK